MGTIKPTHKKPYDTCLMCGYCGTIRYHHIIPRRFKVKSTVKSKLIWAEEDGTLLFTRHKARIERLMIPVCEGCHKKLHPENYWYHANEKLLSQKQ